MKSELEVWIRPSEVNFAPANVAEEVIQNVITICSTVKGSVPMDRVLGVEARFLDEAMNVSMAKYRSEVIRAVRRFESRARVTRVEFAGDVDGKLRPKVWVRIVEG